MLTRRNIPNLLTMLRLVLAAAFFALLAFYQVGNDQAWLLIPAIVLFIAAALTDAMDGYYARLWHVESKFGRIMDPFCDKVLVIGAPCFLAGPGFTYLIMSDGQIHAVQFSGVYPWMVVVIIARELLVTGIRGEMESTGHKFGANLWGKLKMILQAIVIPIVLFAVLLIEFSGPDHLNIDASLGRVIQWTRDILVYATVIVTVISGLPYVTGAYRVTKAESQQQAK